MYLVLYGIISMPYMVLFQCFIWYYFNALYGIISVTKLWKALYMSMCTTTKLSGLSKSYDVVVSLKNERASSCSSHCITSYILGSPTC